MISNPRLHACKETATRPDGVMVECGRTPMHSGVHVDTSLSYRWSPPLVGIDGDDQATDIPMATPNLSVVS